MFVPHFGSYTEENVCACATAHCVVLRLKWPSDSEDDTWLCLASVPLCTSMFGNRSVDAISGRRECGYQHVNSCGKSYGRNVKAPLLARVRKQPGVFVSWGVTCHHISLSYPCRAQSMHRNQATLTGSHTHIMASTALTPAALPLMSSPLDESGSWYLAPRCDLDSCANFIAASARPAARSSSVNSPR
jgi:hypothetical protein